MKNKKERKRIIDRFPKVFAHPSTYINSPEKIYIGDGWLPLLEWYCIKLNALAEQKNLSDLNWPYFVSIKEKLGGLRMQACLTGFDLETRKVAYHHLDSAIKAAKEICESCGDKGTFRDRDKTGWMHVYCDKCEESYLKNYAAL